MLEEIFVGLFDTEGAAVISPVDFLLCIGVSLLLGVIMATAYMYRTRYTKSFVVTLALLPAVVCVVIMMVNGNVGAGVAVAGAFSLVRFRSAPGTAKDIGTLFIGMGTGIIIGMGYIAYGIIFTVVMSVALIIYNRLDLGGNAGKYKTLSITIPEDLSYSGVFDEVLDEYTTHFELTRVKTTCMGSLYKLTYLITLRDPGREKEFIDKLRERNGNLEIYISTQENAAAEL